MRSTDNCDQIRLMNLEARKRYAAYAVLKERDGEDAPTTNKARRHWEKVQTPLGHSLDAVDAAMKRGAHV